MNFYRYREFFINRLYNYFGLAHGSIMLNNSTKKRIYLMGKLNLKNFLFYLIFCIFFILIGGSSVNWIPVIGKYSYIVAVIVFFISFTLVMIKVYKLRKKMIPESSNVNIYERELPSKLRPAHVRLMMTDGLVDELSLASTLLDLVDRDYLKIEYHDIPKDKLNIFKNKNIIISRTDKQLDDLFEYEKYLINWFLGYNDGISITSEKLHNSLNLDINDDNQFPSDKMNFFSALVLMSFPLEKYYNKIKKGTEGINWFLFIIIGFLAKFNYIGEFLGIYGLGMLLFGNPSYTLNQEGVNLESSYNNLKKYLDDFSHIDDKNAQMVELWSFYLTYSIVLEIKSVASKELKDFFGSGIFKGVHDEKNRYPSTKEDALELQINIKDWYSILEKERAKELAKYN